MVAVWAYSEVATMKCTNAAIYECTAALYQSRPSWCIGAFLHWCIPCCELTPRISEPFEFDLQRLELLAGLAELSFGSQPLIVRQVARGVLDERVDVGD